MTRRWVPIALAGLALAVASARAALPPAFGGTLTLPAQALPRRPDPRNVQTPLEASVVDAVYDTLYAADARGRITPLLASAQPRRDGDPVVIPLREGVLRQDGRPLTPVDVIASLNAALGDPRSAWLLAPFARSGAGLAAAPAEPHSLRLELRVARADVAHLLASRPLAIRAGAHHDVGTGPYRARLRRGALELHLGSRSLRPQGYLRRFRFTAPRPAVDEARALALGELDASWTGAGLYSRAHARWRRSSLGRSAALLLLRNRASGPLSSDGAWGRVARLVDVRRLRRLGLDSSRSVSYALGPPALPAAAGSTPRRVRLLARAGHRLEAAAADTIAAMLEEGGLWVEIRTADGAAYARALARGAYDLRFETVVPPLPSPAAILGAAFAAAGQRGRARAMAELPNLVASDAPRSAVTALDALVLGRRVDALTHPTRLAGMGASRFDGLLHLSDLHLLRVRAAETGR